MTDTLEPPQLDMPDTDAPRSAAWGRAHHVLMAFVAAAALVWLMTGFYNVRADELAIVERFGAFVRTAEGRIIHIDPGWHFGLPWPIDRVFKVPVQQTRRLEVNTFNTSPDQYARFREELTKQQVPPQYINAIFDPYLITSDKNVIHVAATVQYRIKDPEEYLMAVAQTPGHPVEMRDEMFREVVEHVLVEAVGKLSVDYILFDNRSQVPGILLSELRKALTRVEPDPEHPEDPARATTRYLLGVDIEKVDVTAVQAPALVRKYFDDVLAARSEQQVQKDQAQAEAKSAVTQAQGQQATILGEAGAYAKQATDAATGEAERFKAVLERYQQAPEITRYDLYVSTINAVMSNVNRTYFVQKDQQLVIPVPAPEKDVRESAAQQQR